MITKVGTNHFRGQTYDVYMLSGTAGRDAENKPVNGKDHATVSVACVEQQDGTTMWVSVNGWRELASAVLGARKGSAVFAIGQLKPREYNGKTYYDLDAEFVSVCGVSGGAAQKFTALESRIQAAGFADIAEEDGELPF